MFENRVSSTSTDVTLRRSEKQYDMIRCDIIQYMMVWYDMIYDTIWHDMTLYDIWYDMIWYDMIWYDMIWYDMIWYDMIWYDMIWYDMIWYMTWHDEIWYDDMIWYIFNCNCVATRWQQYSTHLHTNSTQNDTNKQYIEQHKNFGRVRAVPRLCGLYPGICLTTQEKARKNTSAKSVKEFISGHSAYIFYFDETAIRDLHTFLLYVTVTNIDTDQVIFQVWAYKNYTYVYTGKLHGILKVNNAREMP